MIVSLSDFKTYLDYGTGTSEDPFLTECVNSSQELIEKYLNYTLEKSNKTVILNGNDANEIDFARSFVPLVTFTQFRQRETPITAWETVDTSNYAVYQKNGLNVLYYNDGLLSSREYYFAFESGYLVADVPNVLKNICKEIAASIYQVQKESLQRIKKKGENNGGTTVTYEYDMIWNKGIEERLKPFRVE